MEFFEIVKGRRSIRVFTDRPVEAEKIERVLETALAAPLWRQPRLARTSCARLR